MKVRISGNSIRFRLKQSEVQTFGEQGTLSEITEFGMAADDALTFTLSVSPSNAFSISNSKNTIVIEVPELLAKEWTQTGLVGFEEQIDTGKGKIIKILVEKDFKCLDGSDKENEDSFPNPNLHC